MSEKIKVTQEIADAIIKVKHHFNLGAFTKFLDGEDGFINREHKILRREYFPENKDVLLQAIFYGYEIKPEFKVGQYIVYENGAIKNTMKITVVNKEYITVEPIYKLFEEYNKISVNSPLIRHATPEEITIEKQRRWWRKYGRKVWELRKNDELTSNIMNTTYRVVQQGEQITGLFKLNHPDETFLYEDNEKLDEIYRVKIFAEDRKDL